MGRIHVLSENVANKIAAGEVVERPASVAKELLENSLDAGATRIRIQVEAGGKKLIQITDNGCGMVRDDALLAFERHATSKIKNAEDLLSVATLGFRGEALPSIASVSRLRLETRDPDEDSGTVIEINGGKIFKVEEAGLPAGTSITVRDLFFNIPARKKFLKAESTELSHIASLVTHYALAHPDKHFELHSATNAMLVAPPVAGYSERVYQVFGKEVLDQLIPIAALQPLERIGLPQPPPWRRKETEFGAGAPARERRASKTQSRKPARPHRSRRIVRRTPRPRLRLQARNPETESQLDLRLRQWTPDSRPPDPARHHRGLPQHSAAYGFPGGAAVSRLAQRRSRRQCAPLEDRSPFSPAECHARFRARLDSRRPDEGAPGATVRSRNQRPPQRQSVACGRRHAQLRQMAGDRNTLRPYRNPSVCRLRFRRRSASDFSLAKAFRSTGNAALSLVRAPEPVLSSIANDRCAPPIADEPEAPSDLAPALASLKPLGQIRDSFILAVNPEGLWIVDQHVAHERVLFEKILKQRAAQKVESQRLLLPLVLELTPAQQAAFTEISDELARNGFEVEPFGARSMAVKIAPAGIDAAAVEHMLHELLDQFSREEQGLNLEKMNLEKIRARIAASIACHAAIKVNMPLEQNKMEWLLAELAKTDCPMTCPHGRPVVLRYSLKDIQKAFKRI